MTGGLRIGVVGLGYWGPNLVRNVSEMEDLELAVVCDRREERLDVLRRRYPGARTTTEYESVVDDPGVDAVLIATPVSSHYALALQALHAGKHVFVEKPLAGSSREAAELKALAERSGLVLMPGHTFLYSPPVVRVKQLIDDGALGEIYFVSTSRVNLGLHQADVSVVWDLAPHDFSILRYWLGERPAHVAATARSCILPDTPDVAFINLECPSGTLGHVELSWLAPSKLRRTMIVGSNKMVLYDDTSNEPVRVFDSGVLLRDPETFGEYRLTYRTGDIVSPKVEAVEPLAVELGDLAAAIRTGQVPRSSAELGLDVIDVIEAAERSIARDGERVAVDSTPREPAPVALEEPNTAPRQVVG